jgi:hypothetical protein
MIKSPAQYCTGNQPRVTARKAWRFVTCGQPTSRLGRGLAARCSHAAACAHAQSRAGSARPWRGHHMRDACGGMFADGPTAANRR